MGQLTAVHLDGTLQEVEAQHVLDVVLQIAVILEHVGNGGVVNIARSPLRSRYLAVIFYGGIAGDTAYEVYIFTLRIGEFRKEHVGHNDCTGIDERIARNAVVEFKLYQRVESRARRLFAHSLPKSLAFERKGHRE